MPHLRLPEKRGRLIAGIGGIGVLALVLVVAIIHFLPADVTIQAGPTPTYGPTPTLAPTQPLRWMPLAVPAVFNQPGSVVNLVLAPNDAHTAYACLWSILEQSAAPEVWVTPNGGD